MFEWRVRVYLEDTDSGGIVYHSNYLKFLERGRTEWLRNLGIDQSSLKKIDFVMFVVNKLDIKFLKPAQFNDELIIKTNMLKIKKCSLKLNQKILKKDMIIADAQVEIACIDSNLLKVKKIPLSIIKKMEIV